MLLSEDFYKAGDCYTSISNDNVNFIDIGKTSNYSRHTINLFNFICQNKTLYYKIQVSKPSNYPLQVIAYRRIGTNI